MNIQYLLIAALFLTLFMFLFSIYKIITLKNEEEPKRYPLRRKNALTEEEFENVLNQMNEKKNLQH